MKFKELKNKFNKKYAVRIIAGVLSIALIGTSAAVYSAKDTSAANVKTQTSSTIQSAADDSILATLLDGVNISEKEIGKEETVYLFSDANGNVTRTLVSDRLVNTDKKDTLSDRSNLTNIVNVKGNETFTEKDGALTWQADGSDIYYQGETSQEAPVSQKVIYYLDGKEITPEDLAGKSGKVTIRFDYTNNTSYTAKVDGKDVTVKVPFAALSAVLLDTNFSNVEVTNGKVQSADGKSLVIGYALPGMNESLDVEEDTLPEYVEITADVENFELKTAMTLVVNASNYVGTDGIDLSDLDAKIAELQDATTQLQDGSGQLADGLDELKGKLVEFVDGMNTLNNSKDALASGVTTLNASALSLNDGVKKLDAALKTAMTEQEIAAYKAQAVAAVDQKFANGALAATTDQFYKGLRYNADGSNSDLYNTMVLGVTESVYEQKYVEAQGDVYKAAIAAVMQGSGATKEQAAAAVSAMDRNALLSTIKADPTYASYSDAEIAEALYAKSGKTTTLSEAVKAGIANDATAQTQIAAGVDAAIKKIAASAASGCQTAAEQAAGEAVITGISSTKQNIAAQIEAVQSNGYSLVTGMNALAAGTTQLANSVPTLTSGITKLADASLLIQSGVGKLDDGANELADGIVTFSEDGIDKLVDAYDGDVKALADNMQAIIDAGEDYQTFTDISSDTNGSVKFIYKLGSITL